MGKHTREQCWAKKDDDWLRANPGKGPRDLPNWWELAKAARAGKGPAKAASATTTAPDAAQQSNSAPNVSAYATTVRCPTAAHTTVILDSGAEMSCFKEGTLAPLQHPVTVHGAGSGMSLKAAHKATLPCPALPNLSLTGLHSPAFRHNLVDVRDLQSQGVQVLFPPFEQTAPGWAHMALFHRSRRSVRKHCCLCSGS